MNQRITTILVIALLVSLLASYVVYRTVTTRMANSPNSTTTQITVAARTLETGTLLRDTDLTTGVWTGTVPKGVALKRDGLAGRGVVATIYEGEPISESRLAPAGAGAGLAATIPPGMRACAVKVNDIVGVAGFAVPGMKVDVLISGTPPGQSNEPKVKTLLQNITVLSAGQNYQRDAEGKPVTVQVVNLLVTPEQAEVLSLAGNETRIQLVLRNPLDTQVAKTNGTGMANLFGEVAKPPAPARPRATLLRAKAAPKDLKHVVITLPPYEIEVLNGARRTEAKFARRPEEQQ